MTPTTTTGRWLADWLVEDGAVDRLPEGWDDPHALIRKVEAEAAHTDADGLREALRFQLERHCRVDEWTGVGDPTCVIHGAAHPREADVCEWVQVVRAALADREETKDG